MSYNRRGPTVESERWRRIQALYQAALAQDAHKRAGYLEEVCARDETLRAEVEVLLQHAEPPSTFVDLPDTQLSPHTVDGPPVLIGTQLGCYQIIGLLGSGGMGHVFKARDPRLGRFVAIKILSDRFSARFEREARAVAALNHPNVCTLYDIGPNYLVMEFVEGRSLAAHLRDGPLEEDTVLRYGIQVAEALAAAHAQGIVHRDLKPENVLITTDDRVKLMDFGLALMLSPSAPSDRTVTTYEAPVTQPGTVLGTFPYMSPEQARGENAEPTSDIFSLGSLLYEAISGRRAFARPSAADTIAAILKDEPAPLDGQLELDRIIRRCLAKDAKQRFQTAREVGAALAHARTGAKPQVGSPPIDFDSLAVLPFVNMAGDEDTEYLCEGIAETLINHLSQVSTLRVVARTTAFKYKGEPDAQKVARELRVSALLSGNLVKRGDMLNVQAELIDPGTATQLWGQKYHRKLTDIFVVEEEIAREIVTALRLKLVPSISERLSRRSTDNVEAYQLCLKGRFFWNRRTREALDRAIACYREAIELEPAYAVAYAGLADCYNVLGTFAVLRPGDVFPRARAAARRALDIDEELVAARVALAAVSAWYDRDYAVSDREFLQAIKTNPQYPEARQWYGVNLCVRGRMDEGIHELQRAQQLDPLSPMLNVQLASGYYFARRYAQATEILRKTLEIDGNFGPAHWFLGKAYGQQGAVDRAVAELQMAVDSTDRGMVFLATLGWGLGAAGRIKEAEHVLDELRSRSVQEYVSSICFALVHVGLGDRLATVERLREALAERSAFATWIKVDPMFDVLRGDPEFEALLHSLN